MATWPLSTDVGADIESLCGKCGDVWHVVVAKVGDKIAKVQCKQCGGLHRYKPPPGSAGAAKQATGRRRSSVPRSKSTVKAVEGPRPVPVARDPHVPPIAYSIQQTFEVGDRVDHRIFGVGIVEELLDAGKMRVFFNGERKVLAMAKPAPALERPNRFVDE